MRNRAKPRRRFVYDYTAAEKVETPWFVEDESGRFVLERLAQSVALYRQMVDK